METRPIPYLNLLPLLERPRPTTEALHRFIEKDRRRRIPPEEAADILLIPVDLSPAERLAFVEAVTVRSSRAFREGVERGVSRNGLQWAAIYLAIFYPGWFPAESTRAILERSSFTNVVDTMRQDYAAGWTCPVERDYSDAVATAKATLRKWGEVVPGEEGVVPRREAFPLPAAHEPGPKWAIN